MPVVKSFGLQAFPPSEIKSLAPNLDVHHSVAILKVARFEADHERN